MKKRVFSYIILLSVFFLGVPQITAHSKRIGNAIYQEWPYWEATFNLDINAFSINETLLDFDEDGILNDGGVAILGYYGDGEHGLIGAKAFHYDLDSVEVNPVPVPLNQSVFDYWRGSVQMDPQPSPAPTSYFFVTMVIGIPEDTVTTSWTLQDHSVYGIPSDDHWKTVTDLHVPDNIEPSLILVGEANPQPSPYPRPFDMNLDLTILSWNSVPVTMGTFSISGEIAPVPIPGAIWLLGSGLIALIGIRRKFRKR